MFEVYMTNFKYYLDKAFATLEEAIEAGKKAHFEFVVCKNREDILYVWSPICGGIYKNA